MQYAYCIRALQQSSMCVFCHHVMCAEPPPMSALFFVLKLGPARLQAVVSK